MTFTQLKKRMKTIYLLIVKKIKQKEINFDQIPPQ